MSYADVFKRYEIKFILNPKQKQMLMNVMKDHMQPDEYGRTTIRNVYYDTPDYFLIRNSLEKPRYKEKLRVRSYEKVSPDDKVYVEIKNKYDGIVYKRRTAVKQYQAEEWLAGQTGQPFISQIADEIEYFRRFHRDLSPACYLSYEREAYYSKDGSGMRLTLDENILGRVYDMTLIAGAYGECVLPSDLTLMELKVSEAIPLWMIRFLTDNRINKVSFSKYGTFFKNNIRATRTKIYGGLLYA